MILGDHDILALKQELNATRHDTSADSFKRLFLENKIEKFQLPGWLHLKTN
jgi:hypothetical protein